MKKVAFALVLLAGCGGAPATPRAPTSTAPSATPHGELRIVLRATAKVSGERAAKPFSRDATWTFVTGAQRHEVSLRALGMSAEEAWRVALDNTRHALPAEAFTLTNNQFIVFQHDDAPATLLFPELLVATAAKHLPPHDGHLLAAAPEENVVLYAVGGPDEVMLLRAAAQEGKTSARPLSEVVMEWDGQAWHEAN